ncbi:hypothetical protein llap_18607 [Limosa lapponica baueri]|uniref:Uncharacterized protein n=1 Tax=Limosa lapponica baueri TaxID=1758121 RepID=A0A2I0TBB0_LIMLA|nr:hypothetical protein llap_18607 [Limosa lapponica baueri]
MELAELGATGSVDALPSAVIPTVPSPSVGSREGAVSGKGGGRRAPETFEDDMGIFCTSSILVQWYAVIILLNTLVRKALF